MTMQTQVLYRGKFGAEKPTESQLTLLRRMGVKEEIIRSLDRKGAYELIRLIMAKYYEEKTRRLNLRVTIKW